mgnify:CR=1 FL=1
MAPLNDSLGVPLLDMEKVDKMLGEQRKHLRCIADPVGLARYNKTASLMKGGVELPVYRCARGSSSLESFHLHLNRFIPVTNHTLKAKLSPSVGKNLHALYISRYVC